MFKRAKMSKIFKTLSSQTRVTDGYAWLVALLLMALHGVLSRCGHISLLVIMVIMANCYSHTVSSCPTTSHAPFSMEQSL